MATSNIGTSDFAGSLDTYPTSNNDYSTPCTITHTATSTTITIGATVGEYYDATKYAWTIDIWIYLDGQLWARHAASTGVAKGTKGKKTYGSGATYTWNHSHAAESHSVQLKTYMSRSGTTHTNTDTINFTNPAKFSWTVASSNYPAGNFSSLTKWAGENLTLWGSAPAKTRWTFNYWRFGSTVDSSQTNYSPGGTLATDFGYAWSSATLYAYWSTTVYTGSWYMARCDVNGNATIWGSYIKVWGTGAYASEGCTVTLTPSANGASASTSFVAGSGTHDWGPVVINANAKPGTSYSVTLGYRYTFPSSSGGAWIDNSYSTTGTNASTYSIPTITQVNAFRSTSAGAANDSGTCITVTALITITAGSAGGASDSQSGPSSVKITCNGTTITPTYSSSSLSQTVRYTFTGPFNVDNTYTGSISVTDKTTTVTQSFSVAPMTYLMDMLAGENGLAIGGPAKYPNVFQVHNFLSMFGSGYTMMAIGPDMTPGVAVPSGTPILVSLGAVHVDSAWNAWEPYSRNGVNCYRSKQSYHVANAIDKCTVYFKQAGTYYLYYGSYAQTSYDYTVVSYLGQHISYTGSGWSTALVAGSYNIYASSRSNQLSYFSNYYTVSITDTNISNGTNFVDIWYGKNTATNSYDDRGYFTVTRTLGYANA